jgi:hypothetical protein
MRCATSAQAADRDCEATIHLLMLSLIGTTIATIVSAR